MAAAVMDSIVILDDDEEEERPQPSSSANHCTPPKVQQPAPTHITKSPFATAKKETHVLQAENQKLFTEFVEYCSAHTEDCPEVMKFLHAKHAKASPEFLASVEFRNTLGRCLTRAQARRTKTFVYINELCTVLKQHSAKRRPTVTAVEPTTGEKREEEAAAEELPSTSGQQEEPTREEEAAPVDDEKERKTKKASRRQIAYLENLLKMYNDEIQRLQEKELSISELEEEDSSYIQEHKLKRKMMKIYDKLCELKGCTSLTGRVIEQKIPYEGTRYPEINRKIQRFINSPEAQLNPPDYTDILQQVRRANERHGLNLTKKQLNQIAQDAFRETGNRLQERRHLDMVYNFGSHLTDVYKLTMDPALVDPTLARKLRANREVALSSLDQVIAKYALKQDDTEEEERRKRLERERQKKESSEQEAVPADENPLKSKEDEEEVEEQAEEEDDEDDMSSDPDIEEEIEASKAEAGPEGEEEDDDDINEVETTNQSENEAGGGSDGDQDEGENKEDDKNCRGISPLSLGDTPLISSLADDSPTDSPSQSEAMEVDKGSKSSSTNNGEDVVSSNHLSVLSVSTSVDTKDTSASPAAPNQVSLPPSPVLITIHEDSCTKITETRSANCSPRPPSPKDASKGRKRKTGQDVLPRKSLNGDLRRHSQSVIPLDTDVIRHSPLQADSTTPTQEAVTSSQSTPPPKKNKINVATQCDPDEVIVLSDSD